MVELELEAAKINNFDLSKIFHHIHLKLNFKFEKIQTFQLLFASFKSGTTGHRTLNVKLFIVLSGLLLSPGSRKDTIMMVPLL